MMLMFLPVMTALATGDVADIDNIEIRSVLTDLDAGNFETYSVVENDYLDVTVTVELTPSLVMDHTISIIDWDDGTNAVAYLLYNDDVITEALGIADGIEDVEALQTELAEEAMNVLTKGIIINELNSLMSGDIIWIIDGTEDEIVFLRIVINATNINDISFKGRTSGYNALDFYDFDDIENNHNSCLNWGFALPIAFMEDEDKAVINWTGGTTSAKAYLFFESDFDDIIDKLGDGIDDADDLISELESKADVKPGKNTTSTALDIGDVIWIVDGLENATSKTDGRVFLRIVIFELVESGGGGGVFPPPPDAVVPPINDATDFVKGLFEFILGRDSDPEGLEYWVNELISGNVPGRRIGVEFVNSAEFKAMMDSLSPEELITVLYRGLLGREPDPEGFAYWVSEINRGVSLAGIARTFAEIGEFRALLYSIGIMW